METDDKVTDPTPVDNKIGDTTAETISTAVSGAAPSPVKEDSKDHDGDGDVDKLDEIIGMLHRVLGAVESSGAQVVSADPLGRDEAPTSLPWTHARWGR